MQSLLQRVCHPVSLHQPVVLSRMMVSASRDIIACGESAMVAWTCSNNVWSDKHSRKTPAQIGVHDAEWCLAGILECGKY